jgi:uncharacterized membrane protein
MLTSHFPSFHGSRFSWALLLVLMVAGAAVRHVMNLRFTYERWLPALAVTLALSVGSMYALLHAGAVRGTAAAAVSGNVTFDEVRSVIDRRCATCHSSRPADLTFGPAPAGVAFDTPEQIHAFAIRIRERAYATHTMPPANKTRITDEERAMLGHWAELQR